MTILEEIAEKTRLRVARAKLGSGEWGVGSGGRGGKSPPPLQPFGLPLPPSAGTPRNAPSPDPRSLIPDPHSPLPTPHSLPFEQALSTPQLSFICEVKKASPSKGIIAENFPYLDIAKEYEAAGAAAISVLTEPDYFQGDPRYLKEIAAEVNVPVLRKDFVIDAFQLYEAKVLGAGAVLLICALLDAETLAQYIKTTAELDMAALVEIHDEEEAEMAVEAGARIIGINNRDLKTFKVDFNTGIRLRKRIPGGILTVAESGIKSPTDVRSLQDAGFDAVLIGESLMRAPDKRQFLVELRRNGE